MRRRRYLSKINLDRQQIDNNQYVDEKAKDIITYWSLLILLKLNGHREFVDKSGDISGEDLAYFLNLERFTVDSSEYERQEVIDVLRNQLGSLEKKRSFSTPKILEKNLSRIQEMLQLNSVEMDLLTFTIYIHYYNVLDVAGDTLGRELTTDKVEQVLAVLLSSQKSEIKAALSPKAKLVRSGLVTFWREGTHTLQGKLEILSGTFIDKMMTFDGEIDEMIKDAVRKCAPTMLDLDDFKHIENELSLLVPYLRQAFSTKQEGVNILLYGPPGTGKTELSKVLAEKLGLMSYEISYADENDEAIEGAKRLKAFKVAQSFFAQKELLLMFDEIEDVFSNDADFSFFGPSRQKNKGWINRMLETNAIPTIWITNDVRAIDKAVVRRFDMSIEVPIPPKAKRQEIIENYSEGLLSQEAIKKIAKDAHIAPALISRAAKVVGSVREETTDTSKAFEQVINSTLKAQGHREITAQSDELVLPASYDLSLINTTADLQKIVEGIRDIPSARLCFYGVPGTGKSAFGKYLAEELERPFMLKKGSDLISMWVGGTEKNIAAAFKEAKEEGAVLVFDEVDSFLQDRRSAKQSWEVTQVNEMLVQMENYEGIFIATTNLMDGLDQASLRRFDLKLEFNYLKRDQSLKLFLDEAKGLKIRKPSPKIQAQLSALRNLAPGDFAAVKRQHRFNPITNALDFVERLREECSVKEDTNSHKMGFVV